MTNIQLYDYLPKNKGAIKYFSANFIKKAVQKRTAFIFKELFLRDFHQKSDIQEKYKNYYLRYLPI